MSDIRSMLVETSRRVFATVCTSDAYERAEAQTWQPQLWAALEDAGLTDAARSADREGSGIELADALAAVRQAGAACVPAPLAETMLAELALAAAGLPPRPGVLTVGPVLAQDSLVLERKGAGWTLSGTAHRIPWGRHARAIVLLARDGDGWATVVVDTAVPSKSGVNFAHEPRDDYRFDAQPVPGDSVARGGYSPADLRLKGALFRVAAMAGALERILAMTVSYALERVQFGRPIAKFQAIQQQIAVMATQVGAASAAAEAMLEALRHGPAHFEIAAAKLRVGEAAGIAAGIAHQVHGAMGFTYEHALHRSTRRLWSWRDEFGSENEWADWLGALVAGMGAKGLWPFLTSDPKVVPADLLGDL
jgi:acyl-CoA dehydrogenase